MPSHVKVLLSHARVPNTDLANFPVLISGVYPYLANVANGGKVQSASGYDIVFTSDAVGASRLDHEVESSNAATGQFTAWVRIPVLSHSADTVLYLNYGNGSVTTSQENRAGGWDSSYKGVWNGAELSRACGYCAAKRTLDGGHRSG